MLCMGRVRWQVVSWVVIASAVAVAVAVQEGEEGGRRAAGRECVEAG